LNRGRAFLLIPFHQQGGAQSRFSSQQKLAHFLSAGWRSSLSHISAIENPCKLNGLARLP
jgi:hypothetical protein